MKMSEWAALCEREHASGREVVGVTLIPRSAQEMANEALADASAVTILNGDSAAEAQPERIVAGARVGQLVNPATGTVIDVGINPDAAADMITVGYPDGRTRIVVIAASAA